MHDRQRGDRAGEHDVEAAQPGALVGLGRRDGGGLDDDGAVELQTLGDAGRHDLDLVVLVVAVVAVEPPVVDPGGRKSGREALDDGIGGDDADRAGCRRRPFDRATTSASTLARRHGTGRAGRDCHARTPGRRGPAP